jgi:VIT1/CCC1 family predicted Fe2+/Mn2+ transporter
MPEFDNETYDLPSDEMNNNKLNKLRAAVLGANDGIVSIAGLVVGVAGATNSVGVIFTAGMAGIIAGAISMAAGEYVSVSSQRDSERALLEKERIELLESPEQELNELTAIYIAKGLSKKTAQLVAQEFTAKDAYAAHVDAELNLDPDNLTNPWHAAYASAASFLLGAAIPLFAIILPSASIRVPVAFVAVIAALFITGTLSAVIGGANVMRAVVRVVVGGAIAMIVTYAIGTFFGVKGI